MFSALKEILPQCEKSDFSYRFPIGMDLIVKHNLDKAIGIIDKIKLPFLRSIFMMEVAKELAITNPLKSESIMYKVLNEHQDGPNNCETMAIYAAAASTLNLLIKNHPPSPNILKEAEEG